MVIKAPAVLIVDTSQAQGASYARHFEKRGWITAVVTTLLDAERKAVRMRPTILVIDVASLIEAEADLKRLHSLPTLLKTAFVVLAKRATSEQVAKLLEAGANELILTPHATPSHVVEHIEAKYL
ncbi:MAG: hypothetical protein NUV56_03810 [Candidatus Uhrbacteria bacterium]|nr:hypothetical protein [Candidatus Uhrbacteria bacterium]